MPPLFRMLFGLLLTGWPFLITITPAGQSGPLGPSVFRESRHHIFTNTWFFQSSSEKHIAAGRGPMFTYGGPPPSSTTPIKPPSKWARWHKTCVIWGPPAEGDGRQHTCMLLWRPPSKTPSLSVVVSSTSLGPRCVFRVQEMPRVNPHLKHIQRWAATVA